MSELMLVKKCGHIAWNKPWMEYLKGRIVRAEKIWGCVYRIKTSSYFGERLGHLNDRMKMVIPGDTIPVRSRGYWVMQSEDLLIITPEIRAKLIDQFKKDRSMFVLKDKIKE